MPSPALFISLLLFLCFFFRFFCFALTLIRLLERLSIYWIIANCPSSALLRHIYSPRRPPSWPLWCESSLNSFNLYRYIAWTTFLFKWIFIAFFYPILSSFGYRNGHGWQRKFTFKFVSACFRTSAYGHAWLGHGVTEERVCNCLFVFRFARFLAAFPLLSFFNKTSLSLFLCCSNISTLS